MKIGAVALAVALAGAVCAHGADEKKVTPLPDRVGYCVSITDFEGKVGFVNVQMHDVRRIDLKALNLDLSPARIERAQQALDAQREREIKESLRRAVRNYAVAAGDVELAAASEQLYLGGAPGTDLTSIVCNCATLLCDPSVCGIACGDGCSDCFDCRGARHRVNGRE